MTKFDDTTMHAHCPRCDGQRSCKIHGAYDHVWSWEDDMNSENGQTDHRLLQCLGCETVFYWRSAWDSSDYDYVYNHELGQDVPEPNIRTETYPKPEKKSERPDWTWSLYQRDRILSRIMNEVYSAIELNAYILASVGLRTAFDRATEILGIQPSIALAEKVSTLQNGGWIGTTEAENLTVLVNAGSAAAHRGWSPDQEDLKPLLRTLEQFLERTIMSDKRISEIADKIPQRQKKKPKTTRKEVPPT